MRLILLLFALCTLAAAPPPTRAIGPYRLTLPGGGVMPLYATADPAHPPAGITRVVLVLHGLSRDADTYFAIAQAAQAEAGAGAGSDALMIAPQVLAEEDVAAHHPGAAFLHWTWDTWAAGEPANGPEPASLFDAYDALLAEVARIPGLKHVVIAGHSAGGQIAQRYAVVGNGPDALIRAGIAVRFVIANPSSYIWFSADRPLADGGFGAVDVPCRHYADWRYGLTGRLPPYVRGTPGELEARYLARDVVYLLGTRDIDPNHRVLDKSCAGETQGASRYVRGHNYVRYLQWRTHGALPHREADIPGVAHDGRGMLTSACARAAIFDTATCPGIVPP